MGSGTLVVLGSGTSNGVPTPGKEYPEEYLAEPKNHRTRSSVCLLGPTGNVLVDCAPEMRIQLVRERIYDIDSVLITHTHADHVMGMDDLRAFCLKYQREMPIYTAPRYQEDIRRIFPYAFADFPPGIWVPRFEFREVPDVLEVGGMSLRLFWVEHGKVPCLALRVNNVAYITDVSSISDENIALLQGLDTLILDAVRYAPHPNHFHYERALQVAAEIGAKQTFFTHLSDDYDHFRTDAELPSGINLAYDGLRVPF